MADKTAFYPDDVEQVRRRWAEWRSMDAVRWLLAEELWAAAVKLVQRDGIEATMRALHINNPDRAQVGRASQSSPIAINSAKIPAQATFCGHTMQIFVPGD